jgi:hypothetical protein
MQAALHVLIRDQRMTNTGNVSAMRPDDPIAVFEQLSETPVSDEPEDVDMALREAGKAFREFSRKGFAEHEAEDPTIIEGFRYGAGVLLTIAREFDRILDTLKHIDQDDPDLAGWFQRDSEIFRTQFRRLYGAAI